MINEWAIIGCILRDLDQGLLQSFFREYAPCLANRTSWAKEDRGLAALVEGIACLSAGASARLRRVFDSVNRICSSVSMGEVMQCADHFGIACQIVAALPKQSLTRLNLVVWALLYDARLWRRLETEAFETTRGFPIPRHDRHARSLTKELLLQSTFFLMSAAEQQKRIDDFAAWYAEDLSHAPFFRDVTCACSMKERARSYTFAFNVTYRRTIRGKVRGRIEDVSRSFTLDLEYDPLARTLSATKAWACFITLPNFLREFAEHVLDSRTSLREHGRKRYDLSRFANRETAVLPMPPDAPYASACVVGLAGLLRKAGDRTGRPFRLSCENPYDRLEAMVSEGGFDPSCTCVGSVDIQFLLPPERLRALSGERRATGAFLPSVRLSVESREIRCPVQMRGSFIVDMLSEWGLDGEDRSGMLRREFNGEQARNLVRNLGFGGARLAARHGAWVTNRVRLSDDTQGQLVIVKRASDLNAGLISKLTKHVDRPLVIAVEGSLEDNPAFKAFQTAANATAQALQLKLVFDEQGARLRAEAVVKTDACQPITREELRALISDEGDKTRRAVKKAKADLTAVVHKATSERHEGCHHPDKAKDKVVQEVIQYLARPGVRYSVNNACCKIAGKTKNGTCKKAWLYDWAHRHECEIKNDVETLRAATF